MSEAAYEAAMEARAEAKAERWMFVTERDEDEAEDYWARKGVI